MTDAPLTDMDPEAFRAFLRANQLGDGTLDEHRARFDLRGLAVPLPAGCEVERLDLDGLAAERLAPRGAAPGRALLYLHGGGFQIGSPRSIRHLAARIAEAAGAAALVPEYRLAPEHPFPAALEDALAAYRRLLDEVPPARFAVAGDSAGAGLALAAALAAREQGLPPPAALYLISPWVDLFEGGASWTEKDGCDEIVSVEGLKAAAAAYAGPHVRHRHASPLFAELAGLAPMLIQVGSEEVLLSDSTRLAERAGLARVSVRLEIAPDMQHGFPMFHGQLSAARRAVREAGAWLRERLE